MTEIFPKYAVKACDSRADCVRLAGLIDSKILISTIGLLYSYNNWSSSLRKVYCIFFLITVFIKIFQSIYKIQIRTYHIYRGGMRTEEREIKLNFTMNETIFFYPCTEYICLCARNTVNNGPKTGKHVTIYFETFNSFFI